MAGSSEFAGALCPRILMWPKHSKSFGRLQRNYPTPHKTWGLKTQEVADILADMSVGTRKFIRDFPLFREQAEKGGTVVIESREGVKFVFHRIGTAPRPRQVETPLRRKIADRWDADSPSSAPEEWEMNR
jgi:hypothetical protein